MLKKYFIISLLLVAYTIVLGHSIIPHHHHDDDHETEQSSHHQNNHHEDHGDQDHEENAGLARDFENYIHSGSTGDLHQQPDFKISGNSIATAYIIAIFDFQIKPVKSPPPIVRHSNNHIPFLRHSLSPKGLRAPPRLLA
jgi:hypothetical protein